MTTKTAKTMFVENAPLDTPVAFKTSEGEWRVAVVRKDKHTAGVFIVNMRHASIELLPRDRVELDPNPSKSVDAVWCKAHETYKIVTPSGALYCRACSREYMKRYVGVPKTERKTKTAEERAAEREARQQAIRDKAAAEKADRLQAIVEAGIRRTEAFFLGAVRHYGANDPTTRSIYGRYLTDERMDELVADLNNRSGGYEDEGTNALAV